MCFCFVGCDFSGVDKVLNEGVVFGDLGESTVTQEVAAGVAHVCHGEFIFAKKESGDGGAHASK